MSDRSRSPSAEGANCTALPGKSTMGSVVMVLSKSTKSSTEVDTRLPPTSRMSGGAAASSRPRRSMLSSEKLSGSISMAIFLRPEHSMSLYKYPIRSLF